MEDAGGGGSCHGASFSPFVLHRQCPLAEGSVGELVVQRDRQDQKMSVRPKPNYFVAIQITNQQIHTRLAEVQQTVLTVDPRMGAVITQLASLHLTLMVMSLQGQEDINRASDALNECGRRLKQSFMDGLPQLDVAGLETFGGKVVFAKIKPGESLSHVNSIHECVRDCMARHGVRSTDRKKFSPHITVMNMNDVDYHFRKSVARKINPELYGSFKDAWFGRETVSSLQLCAMPKEIPKNESGYYNIAHCVTLKSG